MKTGELRKLVSKNYKNGVISEQGTKPTQPSKIIYNLRGEQLQDIIKTKIINWDDYNNVIWRVNAKNENKKSNSSKKTDKTPVENTPSNDSDNSTDVINDDTDNSNDMEWTTDSEVTEKFPPNSTDNNNANFELLENLKNNIKENPHNYITDKGAKSREEVFNDLGINELLSYVTLSSEQIKKRIDNADFGGSVGDVVINVTDNEPVKLKGEHTHPKFNDILNHIKWDKNVYLYGDAGAGKTTTATQIAKALNLDNFACYSCSAGMSEGLITGRLLFDGSFHTTEFLEIWENGGLILLDEFDAIDGNLAVIMNSALANGILHATNRKENPTAIRHKDCYVIGAGNTDGSGNGSRIYSGRNKLDGATLDRFIALKFDYDKDLERKLSGKFKVIPKVLNKIRSNVQKYEISRVVSTRQFERFARWMSNGKDIKYCTELLTQSWTDFEIEKCEIDSILKSVTVKTESVKV